MAYTVSATLTEEDDGSFTLQYTGEDGSELARLSFSTEAEALAAERYFSRMAEESGATAGSVN